MKKSNYYSVLFTGGIDSTYRICQLAIDEKAVIQPTYIIFHDDGTGCYARPECNREMEAQSNILKYIYRHPNTKAKLLPLRRIYRDGIPEDKRILNLESSLVQYNFGWQYLYIALLAKWEPGIELCHETLPKEFLEGKVKFKEIDGRKWTDIEGMDETLALIFKDVTWPILGTTRQQMLSDIEKWGYSEVWKYIWFCYESVDNKPCGICDNCRVKISEGLDFLFDESALRRYYVYMILTKISKKAPLWYQEYVHHQDSALYFHFNELDKLGREAQSREMFAIIKALEKMSSNKLSSIFHKFEEKRDCSDELMQYILSCKK